MNAGVLVGVLDAETTIVDVRFTVSVTVARLVDVAAVGYDGLKHEDVHVIIRGNHCLPQC